MWLLDYGDEPIEVIQSGVDLLPALDMNYKDGPAMLKLAKEHPGMWFPTSPFSHFCYVECAKSPYRT